MKQLCLLIISIIISSDLCFSKQSDMQPLTIVDMRYLLAADLNDPQQVKTVWDHLHTMATLQGIVNRDVPCLYIKYIQEGGNSIDDYWWNKYRQPGEWLAERDTTELSCVTDAIRYYRDKINGVMWLLLLQVLKI